MNWNERISEVEQRVAQVGYCAAIREIGALLTSHSEVYPARMLVPGPGCQCLGNAAEIAGEIFVIQLRDNPVECEHSGRRVLPRVLQFLWIGRTLGCLRIDN